MKKPALYYQATEKSVKCLLCPNFCIIHDNAYGICRKRKNESGYLYAMNYSETISLNIDPMRKKPLYNYFPDDYILSIGANSCNLTCKFCQNYSSSQLDATTRTISPDELVNICQQKDLKHVAFTYTEPFTWYEYILDAAKILKSNNISAVLVTNGYVNPEPLENIMPYVSAMNIDLKAFSNSFYKDICGGELQPVLDTITYAHSRTHIEISFLLIESLNDNTDELHQMCHFISNLNKDIPLHILRYFPRYKMNLKPTTDKAINNAKDIARKYLTYVY